MTLFPGTAGVSPALSAKRKKRTQQARRLRSQERALANQDTTEICNTVLFPKAESIKATC